MPCWWCGFRMLCELFQTISKLDRWFASNLVACLATYFFVGPHFHSYIRGCGDYIDHRSFECRTATQGTSSVKALIENMYGKALLVYSTSAFLLEYIDDTMVPSKTPFVLAFIDHMLVGRTMSGASTICLVYTHDSEYRHLEIDPKVCGALMYVGLKGAPIWDKIVTFFRKTTDYCLLRPYGAHGAASSTETRAALRRLRNKAKYAKVGTWAAMNAVPQTIICGTRVLTARQVFIRYSTVLCTYSTK